MCLHFAYGIANGMVYLHGHNLIHRDLKTYYHYYTTANLSSQNVLLTEHNIVKIIDFGTSRVVDTAAMMTTNIGTVQYMAPELFGMLILVYLVTSLANEKYTEKADVYAFGIVLWEICTQQQPYADKPSWALPGNIFFPLFPHVHSFCKQRREAHTSKGTSPKPYKTYQVMSQFLNRYTHRACWQAQPSKRPSFVEIRELLYKINQEARSHSILLRVFWYSVNF